MKKIGKTYRSVKYLHNFPDSRALLVAIGIVDLGSVVRKKDVI